MSIKIFYDCGHGSWEKPVRIIHFPAGETGVVLEDVERKTAKVLFVHVHVEFHSNDDLINLMQVVDSVRRDVGSNVTMYLYMPYFPYARQDRVSNAGEALSVKVVATLINSLGFDSVFVDDPHSDVTSALVNNIIITPALKYVEQTLQSIWNDFGISRQKIVLVAPDQGAEKKVWNIANKLGMDMATCSKKRDTLTGEINGVTLHNPEKLQCKSILVVDDICDGGRSFTELAKVIERDVLFTGMQFLYVTHGLFTKGEEVLSDSYDAVYTKNFMMDTDLFIHDEDFVKELM